MNIDVNAYISHIGEFVIEYGIKLLGAAIVLIIGLWIVKILNRSISNMLERRQIDPSLRPFLGSLISSTLKVLLIITVLSMLGIEMTSFIAILGAAGLAIGLALSGTLQNFAGGVMLLILKPFKVGDFVEVSGYTGTVKEIQIFHTVINTNDNKRVVIPNAGLSSNSLINYSAEETRRVDLIFGIAYGDDVEKAKGIIRQVLESDSRILKEPQVFVRLAELADSSLNIKSRAWVSTADYWSVYFDVIEAVYQNFVKEGINVPFPQMDVHMHKVD